MDTEEQYSAYEKQNMAPSLVAGQGQVKVTHHAEVLSVTDVPFRSWISAFLFMVHSQDKVQERKNNIQTNRVSTQDSYVRQQMPINCLQ